MTNANDAELTINGTKVTPVKPSRCDTCQHNDTETWDEAVCKIFGILGCPVSPCPDYVEKW